jgi:hypothetical protein
VSNSTSEPYLGRRQLGQRGYGSLCGFYSIIRALCSACPRPVTGRDVSGAEPESATPSDNGESVDTGALAAGLAASARLGALVAGSVAQRPDSESATDDEHGCGSRQGQIAGASERQFLRGGGLAV